MSRSDCWRSTAGCAGSSAWTWPSRRGSVGWVMRKRSGSKRRWSWADALPWSCLSLLCASRGMKIATPRTCQLRFSSPVAAPRAMKRALKLLRLVMGVSRLVCVPGQERLSLSAPAALIPCPATLSCGAHVYGVRVASPGPVTVRNGPRGFTPRRRPKRVLVLTAHRGFPTGSTVSKTASWLPVQLESDCKRLGDVSNIAAGIHGSCDARVAACCR